MRYIIAIIFILSILGAWKIGRAQSMLSSAPFQVQAPGTHLDCTIPNKATQFCFAGDGLWQSINGGPYQQILGQPVQPTGVVLTTK